MPRPSPFSSKTKRVSGTPVKKPARPAGKSPAKSLARKRPVPEGILSILDFTIPYRNSQKTPVSSRNSGA